MLSCHEFSLEWNRVTSSAVGSLPTFSFFCSQRASTLEGLWSQGAEEGRWLGKNDHLCKPHSTIYLNSEDLIMGQNALFVIMLAHDRNTHNYPSHLQGVGSRISMDSKTQGCPSPLYKMALCAQPSVSGVWHMWIHSTYRKRQQVQQRTLSKQDSCSFHKVLHTRELNHVFMLNFFQIFILK